MTRSVRILGLLAALSGAGTVSCGSPPAEQPARTAPGAADTPAAPAPAPTGIVDVTAEDYSFTAPPTFPSGWVTLRFHNEGQEPHFMFVLELPEGVTFDDYAAGLAQPFGELYRQYRAGELDRETFLERLGATVPEWFFTARRAGGAGFTAGGRSSETTVYLEPGNYTIECYVRAMTEGDTFHGAHGMLRPLIVTEERSPLEPPEADVDIRLSNYAIAVDGDLSAGRHVARVRVEEDPEGLVAHNVHLVRLEGEQSAAEVAAWMDWVDAMLPPAPGELLGGAGQMSAGGESYFAFNLEPGRYAWISEAYGVQGMIHEFTVE